MLQQDTTAEVAADANGQATRTSDESRAHRTRTARSRLAKIWWLLGPLAAPLSAAAWLPSDRAMIWGSAWVAGSLAWTLAARRRSWVQRPGAVGYAGQLVAGAFAAVVFQNALAFSAPSALWFAVIAVHSGWLAVGFSWDVLVDRPTLVAIGGGRTADLKKQLGESAIWVDLGEIAAKRVDAFVIDRQAMSQKALVGVDPSIWSHRIIDAGRVLEDLRGRVELAAWTSDRVSELSRSRSYERFKRAIDLAIVVLSAPVSIPLCVLVALMIRIDSPGPILFPQQRTGRSGRAFRMLKFRSMTTSHDQSPSFTQDGDQRITRVGRLIRSKRLDELPQLLNVLGGSMSMVGPRPEQVPFVERLVKEVPAYDLRHAVKPGITGWAQLEQGYVDSLEGSVRKLEYDLYYATRRSLRLDVAILVKTIPALLRGVETRMSR